MVIQVRQMLMTGEVDNAAVRNALTYLKNQDISVVAESDPVTISLLGALKELNLQDL